MLIRVLIALVLAAQLAHAQPRSALGQPLPDANLPIGTVSVRVLEGTPSKPAANVVVTLAITGGKSRSIATDGSGRAVFDGVAAKSRVTVSVPSKAPDLARSTFLIPETGGYRLMLSTAPWQMPALPSVREISGKAMPTPDLPAGTLSVSVSYDNRNDPKPPAGIPVTLVGYAADGKVTVATKKSDAKGEVVFKGLDTSERTAYFTFAVMPRAGSMDRLWANAIVPTASNGWKLVLSSHRRDSKQPPLDETSPAARGKVWIDLDGAPDPAAPIEVIDAATGKVLAKGTARSRDTYAVLDVKTAPGQVLYAQTTARNESYRSQPVVAIAERGARLAIRAVPRLSQKFDLIAVAEDGELEVQMRYFLDNHSWSPATGPIEVPLPVGFKDLVFHDLDEPYAKPSAKGFVVAGPLPPGGRDIIVGFTLPVKGTRADVVMDLPVGTLGSSLLLRGDRGAAFVGLPPGSSVMQTEKGSLVEHLTIPSGKTLRFGITVPKADPKVIALKKTCRELAPNRESPLAGKPLVDFTAPLLDGKPFKLSSLQGKPVFVTFNASWNSLKQDLDTLPALATKLGGQLVVVMSDTDAADVRKAFPRLPARVVLDKPVGDASLGPITGSWNIRAVPETYVIDRKGTVRFHVVNYRDWSKPEVTACLKTGL